MDICYTRKMDLKENFEFRRTKEWIEYTHKRYLTLEEIRHRLQLSKGPKWKKLERDLLATRKAQSVLIEIKSINKKFWFFESDCIREKLSLVQKIGTEIYDKIHSAKTFEKDFVLNAGIEEALSSAIYEGANTTRARAKQFFAEEKTPKNKHEQMLFNNYLAMEWIKKNQTLEIDQNTLLKVHEIVTRKTLEGDLVNYSGKFRDDDVFVGDHQGVDHRKVPESLDEAIKESTENMRFIHPLLQGVILHYLIAYIHPFFDGNGRTARTLFYLQSMKHNFNFVELLSISAHLKEHGGRYERSFLNANKHQGDITFFIDFALDSMLAALKEVEKKVNFLQKIWKLQKDERLSDEQICLLQKMALNKFRTITIQEFANDTRRSHEMARIELKELAHLDLLSEEKKGRVIHFRCQVKELRHRIQ